MSGQFGIVTSSVPGATYTSVYFDPTSSGMSGWAVGQTAALAPLMVHTASGGGDSWPTNLHITPP